VQVAILTEEIKELTNHLKTHKKDFSSRRGLLAKVALRHKLLRYLEREDEKRFIKIAKALKLKIAKKQINDIDEFFGNEVAAEGAEETKE
jgi:ribosomal protein S15